MILHGIETPNSVRTNSLTENLNDIQEKDRFDIILANPPRFGTRFRSLGRWQTYGMCSLGSKRTCTECL